MLIISDEFRIIGDARNYQIERFRDFKNPKDGSVTKKWETLDYCCSNLEDVFVRLLNIFDKDKVVADQDIPLKQFISERNQFKAEIKSILEAK